MSAIEDAILVRAYPRVLEARGRGILHGEASKGCRSELAECPVALEPPYVPFARLAETATDGASPPWIAADPRPPDELVRMCVWVSPQQACEWNRSELFVKQLSWARHRMAWEIIGNRTRATIRLLCHRRDLPVVRSTFAGQFEQCTLSELGEEPPSDPIDPPRGRGVLFYDFFPSPPYSRLLTRPEELRRTPYATLFASMAILPETAVGLYQVVFAPVAPDHNWHQNIEALQDLEHTYKLVSGLMPAQRSLQQVPSGPLQKMSLDLESKANNDKPIFAAALRIAVLADAEVCDSLLDSLAVVASLFQHGGQPLRWLTADDYRRHIPGWCGHRLFGEALTYRPGFLINSDELTSLVHIPPPAILKNFEQIISPLETLPAAVSLSDGTPIGVCCYADIKQPVCIPTEMRVKHVHAMGAPGTGKSTMLEHMIFDDIRRGHGVAVLDPHRTLIERLLELIPEGDADRVIYFNPGDPYWVPIWNPLNCGTGATPSLVTDELIRALQRSVTGWGDRLEHLLRHAVLATLHLPGGSLFDVATLLRRKSPAAERLRGQVTERIDNELSRTFWEEDIKGYGAADLSPPQHKLSKLLASETVGRMLTQSDSSFHLREIMESGKILLVDLSRVGPETRETLGCFMLSLLHLTALGRSGDPASEESPFHIYCDEAHRFLTQTMEDLIAETRKYNVSLTLAHQYLRQFGKARVDALSNAATAVIFRVDGRDAEYLTKDFRGKVTREDLIALEDYHAIARIGSHIVRIQTQPPRPKLANSCRDEIVARSRAKYCKPAPEVDKEIQQRRRSGWTSSTPPSPAAHAGAATKPDDGRSDGAGDLDYDTL